MYGGRDFYFSCDIVSGASMTLQVNGVTKAMGSTIDFDDMLIMGVTSIRLVGSKWDSTFNSKIYYFKLVEDIEPTPVDLDFQIDLQIDDEYCYFPNSISYSYKTSVSQTIDFDIWNWDTESWDEIESINNYETFDDDIFYLDYGSPYVNSSNGIRIRFQAFDCSADFRIEIDQLRLDYYNIG